MPGLKSWMLGLFGLKAEPKPSAADLRIERRARLAAEALMENESLMTELDSTAAQALLDWGVACARQAAASSAGLDDAAAEAAMAPRMQAARQMMKAISRWVGSAGEASAQTDAQTLEKISGYAALVYGGRFTPPGADDLQKMLQDAERLRQQPEQWIASLRRGLEPRSADQA